MSAEPTGGRVAIDGRTLTITDIEDVASGRKSAVLDGAARERMEASARLVSDAAAGEDPIYGVNTGFGRFAEVRIPFEEAAQLQRNLVRSHSAGVGTPFPREVVRAMIATRANALATGYSGVRPIVVERLLALLDSDVVPIVPSQGSVGACGDLAPLSHLALFLIGEGEGTAPDGTIVRGAAAMERAGVEPLDLHPKEGLALLNGTQASLAVAALVVARARRLVLAADLIGAMTVEGLKGSTTPFRREVYTLRPQPGVEAVCGNITALLAGSAIRESHLHCGRVQDAYCLRCMPQVHGAVRSALRHVEEVIGIELNAATDNPLVLTRTREFISAGNFHGEPVAMAMDYLTIALAELANISERRISAMMEAPDSDLSIFLAERGGLQSGFMMGQVTAASLVSENKVLSHPASVDSIPTGAGREDHVSMSTLAARKSSQVAENAASVLAIEALCAAQAIDFHTPLEPGRGTGAAWRTLRGAVPHLAEDRPLAPDIAAVRALIDEGGLVGAAAEAVGGLA